MYILKEKDIIHRVAERKWDEIRAECITSVSQPFPSALLYRKIRRASEPYMGKFYERNNDNQYELSIPGRG
jgi:hypothetical protein